MLPAFVAAATSCDPYLERSSLRATYSRKDPGHPQPGIWALTGTLTSHLDLSAMAPVAAPPTRQGQGDDPRSGRGTHRTPGLANSGALSGTLGVMRQGHQRGDGLLRSPVGPRRTAGVVTELSCSPRNIAMGTVHADPAIFGSVTCTSILLSLVISRYFPDWPVEIHQPPPPSSYKGYQLSSRPPTALGNTT